MGWTDRDGDYHGFIASRNYAQFLPIDYRIYENGFQFNPRADELRIHDINDRHQIVGQFRVGNKTKGFLLNPFAKPVDEVIMNQRTSKMLTGIGSLQSASEWSQMAWPGTGNLGPLSDRARDAISALLLSENATSIRSSKERMQLRKAALEAAQTKIKELIRDLRRR